MPLQDTFDIKVLFNLDTDIPNFVFTDENDYTGDTLVGGYLKVEGPTGLIYETTEGSPDIIPGTLEFSDILIPTTVEGKIQKGDYIFTYSAVTDNLPTGLVKTKTFSFDFSSPCGKIEQLVDCFSAKLSSRDITEYTVNGITPQVTRIHEVHQPSILEKDALSGNGSYQEVVYPNLYEGEYTTKLDTELLYSYLENIFIATRVKDTQSISVSCDLDLCKLYCAISTLYSRLEEAACSGSKNLGSLQIKFFEVTGLTMLFEQAMKCGQNKDADKYLQLLLEKTNSTDSCSCGSCGCDNSDEPQQVTSFLAGTSTSTANNSWSSGPGVPSNALGNDDDFYIVEGIGDIYKKVSGAWVKIVETKGEKGDTGDAGEDGTKTYKDSGTPDTGLGVIGDFYINEDTSDHYQKSASGWGTPFMNTKGNTGLTGPAGPTGPAGDGSGLPIGATMTFRGLLSGNFDGSGLGINDWTGWAIQNGANGTIDNRGKVKIGLLDTDADFNAVDKQGGDKSITLTSNQSGVAPHTHGKGTLAVTEGNNGAHEHFYNNNINGSYNGFNSDLDTGFAGSTTARATSGGGTHSHNPTLSGSVASATASDAAQAHSNIQPYVVEFHIEKIA